MSRVFCYKAIFLKTGIKIVLYIVLKHLTNINFLESLIKGDVKVENRCLAIKILMYT